MIIGSGTDSITLKITNTTATAATEQTAIMPYFRYPSERMMNAQRRFIEIIKLI